MKTLYLYLLLILLISCTPENNRSVESAPALENGLTLFCKGDNPLIGPSNFFLNFYIDGPFYSKNRAYRARRIESNYSHMRHISYMVDLKYIYVGLYSESDIRSLELKETWESFFIKLGDLRPSSWTPDYVIKAHGYYIINRETLKIYEFYKEVNESTGEKMPDTIFKVINNFTYKKYGDCEKIKKNSAVRKYEYLLKENKIKKAIEKKIRKENKRKMREKRIKEIMEETKNNKI